VQLLASGALGLLPLVGLGPFWDLSLLHQYGYRGDESAFNITVVDLLAWCVLLGVARGDRPVPYRWQRYAYLAFAAMSLTHAIEPLYSWFGLWKVVRCYLLFAAVVRLARDPRGVRALLTGLGLGVLAQLVAVLIQRYGLGYFQARGLFAHQNSLGSAMLLTGPAMLCVALSTPKARLAPTAFAASAVCIVLGLSRGAMAIFAATSVITLATSFALQPTRRKLAIALIGVALSGVVVGRAGDTILERFRTAPAASGLARDIAESAASEMLRDHPMGIGINQYSLVTKKLGYSERAAERFHHVVEGDGDMLIHNIYWLEAVELGVLGLASFLVLMATPLVDGLRKSVAAPGSVLGQLRLGLVIGIVGLLVQGVLEWTLRQPNIAYLLWIAIGLIAASPAPAADASTTKEADSLAS
jgi:O-antigen ligase